VFPRRCWRDKVALVFLQETFMEAISTQGILTLISAIIGILSAWRSYRLARDKFQLERNQARNSHRASLIDDIEQVLNSVKEENGRLDGKVRELEAANRALAQASDHQARRIEDLEQRNAVLTEANVRLTRRVEELKAGHGKLSHLRDNVG